MRAAEASDALRRLSTKRGDWPTRITKIQYEDFGSLGTAEIPVDIPVTVLCGYCGSGKSSVLRLIWTVLDPLASTDDGYAIAKLGAGKASINVLREGVEETLSVTLSDAGFEGGATDVAVTFLEGGKIVSNTDFYFGSSLSLDEIVEGTKPYEVVGSDLVDVQYISRRAYESLEVYEIELSDIVVPFFRATYLGHSYDSRTMGAGELSALSIWWAVERADDGEFLLIEEPESFVSVASQNAIVEHVSRAAVAKKLNVIITSHSAAVIDRLPEGSARFLIRHAGGVRYEPHPLPELMARIGVYPLRSLVMYLEDKVAVAFARSWLSWTDDPVFSHVVMRVEGDGLGGIIRRLPLLPNDLPTTRFLGLADGDSANQVPNNLQQLIALMPGSTPPETMLIDTAKKHAIALSAEFTKNVEQVIAALEGHDLHDWFRKFCELIGLPFEQVVSVLFRYWIGEQSNQDIATAAYQVLRHKALAVLQ
nr:AAA family ATPase [uncultured Devosia sp.]